MKILELSSEISSIKNKINIDNNALIQYNLLPETKNIGEFNFPINFVIINDKLKNLILQYSNSAISSDFEISFGFSTLYIRLKYDLNKIYCYNYQNNSFNLSCIIELVADMFKEIYDRHFSKKPLTQYLNEKQINLGILNQKQELFSSGKKLLGYIYLPSTKVGQNLEQNIPIIEDINIKENILIEGDLNKKIDFNIIYQKFVNSFKTLKDKNLALPNIKTIKGYIASNLLINLPVFIIELQILKYCFETIKQYKNTLDGYSFFLSDDYIINSDLANEYTDYSFINEEIIKYFKVQNINHTKKAHVFFNQKSLFVFYPNQNCLLKILNYKNNAFTIKKLQIPIEPIIPQQDDNHSLGLENIGATCYMNATLQCLSNVRSLREYFLDDNKYYQDVLGRSTELTKSFADVLRKLWSQTSETYYAPKEFKEIISKMNPLFKGIQANDSKDLVLFIYENIHRELNNPSENPIDVNLDNIRNELKLFRNNYYPQNYSIISKIFYYEQTSIMQCKRCNFMTYNYNIMNMIIFPLEKVRLYMVKKKPGGFTNITLNDCFEQNEQPEMLEGSNQIYCNNCHFSSDAISCNKFNTCPEVLTIILNRGKGLEFEVEFSFPLSISIDKYVTEKSFSTNYDLIGVLTHHGPSGMAGHFVAYCKSPKNGEWFFYNDATVTHCDKGNVEKEMVSNGVPYILFYQRTQTTSSGNTENKCIYFTYEGKEGFYEYIDDNQLLCSVYEEIKNKYSWAPSNNASFFLLKNNDMKGIDEYKSLRDNGINNNDKICVIIN